MLKRVLTTTVTGASLIVGCATTEPPVSQGTAPEQAEPTVGKTAQAYTAPTNLRCASDYAGTFNSYSNTEDYAWCNARSTEPTTRVQITQAAVDAARKRAGRYFRYIMGGPLPPAADLNQGDSAETAEFKGELCDVREAIRLGDVRVQNLGSMDACGAVSNVVRLTGPGVNRPAGEGGLIWSEKYTATCGNVHNAPSGIAFTVDNYFGRIQKHVNKVAGWCAGQNNTPTFFKIIADWGADSVDIDPGPAKLGTSALSGTGSAAAAAATFVDDSTATTAYRFPGPNTAGASCTVNGDTALGGEPCNTAATAAGVTVYGVVQKLASGNCACNLAPAKLGSVGLTNVGKAADASILDPANPSSAIGATKAYYFPQNSPGAACANANPPAVGGEPCTFASLGPNVNLPDGYRVQKSGTSCTCRSM